MRRGAAMLLAGALCAAAACAHARTPHLALDVTLDPATRALRVRATLPVAPPAFGFALAAPLAVGSARLDGAPVAVREGAPDGDARTWIVPVAASGTLTVDYAGVLAPLDPALDHRRVLRELPPMAGPDGSYLHAGSRWHPAPADAYSYAVSLALPAGQRGLVPGTLVDEQRRDDGGWTARFAFAHPAQGIDLMAGPYVVAESRVARADGAPLRLRTYFMPGQDALAPAYLEDSARLIARYSAAIGPYPFDDFAIVASPLPTGFGMPGATYIAAAILPLPFVRAASLGHEIAHNWWGNGVFVDYARGNWAEGLTTFMADYAFRENESPAAAREMRVGWLRDHAALAPSQRMAPVDFRARTHGAAAAAGYGKVAMLFVMLRDRLGEDVFAKAVRRFWTAHRFAVAGWDDLRAAFEAECGCALGTFFTQWLTRADAAAPRVVAARADREGREVELVIEQPGAAYALDVPLEFAAGEARETRVVSIDAPRQTVRVPVSRRPETVRVDPQARLWRELARDEQPPILRQWTLAPAPVLAVAGDDAQAGAAARALAARVFERTARVLGADAALAGPDTVLLVGLHDDIDAALARAALPPRPASLAGAGTAQVWTIAQGAARGRVAVVSARDAAALAALARPLPHYGAASHLVFDGARLLARGTWPGDTPAVSVE